MLYVVIMAGGRGTSLWPRSRLKTPKQLSRITSNETMIQEALNRVIGEVDSSRIYVVTNEAQVQQVREQLPQLLHNQVIAEPVGRSTAACIGLAAIIIRKRDPNAVMLVKTADHLIKPASKFMETALTAVKLVQDNDALATFGIKPTYPATIYGYIHRGERIEHAGTIPAYRVKEFKEKPDEETAKKFLESGEYYWNSGMFVWRVDTILKEIEKHMPQLHEALQKIDAAWGTKDEQKVLHEEYEKLDSVQIDYGVMEKAENIIVLEANFQWDDVGNWLALERIHEPDEDGNIVSANYQHLNSKNNIVVGEGDHLIATVDVSDLIIVQTADATLVCSKQSAPKVKKLVAELEKRGLEKYL